MQTKQTVQTHLPPVTTAAELQLHMMQQYRRSLALNPTSSLLAVDAAISELSIQVENAKQLKQQKPDPALSRPVVGKRRQYSLLHSLVLAVILLTMGAMAYGLLTLVIP